MSPELTLHQLKLLADDSPLSLGVVVHGNQELMVSDHCCSSWPKECDRKCAVCRRRTGARRYLPAQGFQFPVTTDVDGACNAVPLDTVHAVSATWSMRSCAGLRWIPPRGCRKSKEARAREARVCAAKMSPRRRIRRRGTCSVRSSSERRAAGCCGSRDTMSEN